jgi:WS/DGAT/MGAT family acyltransferase
VRSFQEQAAALPYQAPRSPLNVSITGARRFAAEDWPLERLDAIRSATGATLNDVLMGMCAGALRRYLLDLGQLPDDPLVAMVPVSLRQEGDDSLSNAVGVVLCNLGTHLDDPEDRFDWVRRSMEQGKLSLRGLTPTGAMLVSALTFAPLALGPLFRFEAFRRPPFNLVISNVPGPRRQLYWNGAKLLGDYPLSIPTHGQAVNITALTVNGDLDIGITGDRNALPSLQKLLEHLETSLVELEQLASLT